VETTYCKRKASAVGELGALYQGGDHRDNGSKWIHGGLRRAVSEPVEWPPRLRALGGRDGMTPH